MTDELMMPEPDAAVLALRVLVAAVLGAALGLEREWRGKEAGLRTNTLIAIGAALFSAVSLLFAGDPGRVAAQVSNASCRKCRTIGARRAASRTSPPGPRRNSNGATPPW